MFSDTKYSFTLQETSWYVEFRATARLCLVKIYSRIARVLYCFLLMLKRQCIRVWLCQPVRCANKWSYRYWTLPCVRLKVQLTIPSEINLSNAISENHLGQKYWIPLVQQYLAFMYRHGPVVHNKCYQTNNWNAKAALCLKKSIFPAILPSRSFSMLLFCKGKDINYWLQDLCSFLIPKE